MFDFREWKHVFKLDPNKEIEDYDLEAICESGTDAVIVGGSDGVTLDRTLDLLARIRRYAVPCALEVSTVEAVTPGFDFYFIPTVLNTEDSRWVTGLHHEAVKEFGEIMNWDEIVMEGYCILNSESKVANLTSAHTTIDEDDVLAYARMAEKMFKLPIFYVEYSGTYGDAELVEKVSNVLDETMLFYGGGIDSPEKAKEMAAYADTVIVGNSIYDNIKQAIKTVAAVKGN
ncbi:heptaprenylglyceryl phosphate synthase [Guptibacillus hwajinpoensis]|uniref:Glycerol-1-phosphate prenyltransferase n=2 Tax=Guptibacillus hwajinpoensis TaxID=208199 RepID=A0ABU0K676_9BACL|nr:MULTISPECIES: heptaprenylglyceryl phosphate synthase [Alkalihalobacillus]KMM35785.1 heptaprenylglyceryl phosphate synthase [Alkalihalobacillus macyae]MDP4552137.1 heptaprenylglyceryl phosphate synthase [Alkalihalobacillus macyae]MDQ0484863.1 putative glycerol-1-phosphate prenyltransferase [Alkalihalobacillus hemicentroti]